MGTWDLFGSEACAAGACGDARCKGASIPGLVLSDEDGLLSASNFTLTALTDPMSDDPFEYPDGASVLCERALAGPVSLEFEAAQVGCGAPSVTVTLHLKPDSAAGGAPPRAVKLEWDVQLSSFYTRKGHRSWAGSVQLVMQRRAKTPAAPAAL